MNTNNSDQSTEIRRIQRAVRQQLESLERAGVRQLGRPSLPERIETSTPSPSDPPSPAKTEEVVAPTLKTSPESGVNTVKPVISAAQKTPLLQALSKEVAACTKCKQLCEQRTQTVFGVGDPNARLCFFGEAPGADEDRLGEPFVGRAGKLLTKIIEAMKMTRDDVYILNTLKCRPPGNRNPTADEVTNCRPYFDKQLEIIQPEFICCLGAVSAMNLLETTTPIGQLRGKFHDWRGIKVIATYHPAYLLRNPAAKKEVWRDMQLLMREMGIELPTKS